MTYADIDRWCQGSCMQGARSKVRRFETAQAAYRDAWAVWRIPLVLPAPPAEPRIGTVIYGSPVYDSGCMYEIKALLSRLDGMACVALREADGMRGQSNQARVSGSSERPSLSPTIEHLDELDGWLRDWKAAYLGCDTFARQGQLSDSITIGTAWLVARGDMLLTRPDMAEAFGTEVHRWYGKLRQFDPADIVVERLKGVRCPECNGFTLERKVGDDSVTCRMRDCDRVLKFNEYQALEEYAKTTVKAS